MTREATPRVVLHGREFPAEAAEISGFGGSYEAGCRLMVLAGVEWLAQHDGATVVVSHFPGIIGVDIDNNVYAMQLTQAMLDAPYDDNGVATTVGKYWATGAMVQFSKQHALRAHRLGWDAYIQEMTDRR